MNKLILISCFLLPLSSHSQIITTIAGDGTSANTGNGGPATSAEVYLPFGSIFDKNGNYYFATGAGETVRKISSNGIITTIAGGGSGGDGGQATSASLNQPVDIGVDTSSNIYIVDAYDNKIRKVDASTGIISTIAGTGTAGYNGDGIQATDAKLNNPGGVCIDKLGNIYIADNLNFRVRKINTTGIISTIAGTGVMGYNGDNILATTAQLGEPYEVCVDNIGDLFIADITGRIRKIDTTGIIHTSAGNGTLGYSGDGGAATDAKINTECIVVDKFGNIFTTEGTENRVRKINISGYISTVAGTGSPAYSGDGGQASTAALNDAEGIAVDSCGNLYISDSYNYRIRKVTFDSTCPVASLGVPKIIYNNIFIYPNPASEILNINNVTTREQYVLLNITGITEQQGELKQGGNTISIQNLPPGLYILEMTDADGKRTVRKIIKE